MILVGDSSWERVQFQVKSSASCSATHLSEGGKSLKMRWRTPAEPLCDLMPVNHLQPFDQVPPSGGFRDIWVLPFVFSLASSTFSALNKPCFPSFHRQNGAEGTNELDDCCIQAYPSFGMARLAANVPWPSNHPTLYVPRWSLHKCCSCVAVLLPRVLILNFTSVIWASWTGAQQCRRVSETLAGFLCYCMCALSHKIPFGCSGQLQWKWLRCCQIAVNRGSRNLDPGFNHRKGLNYPEKREQVLIPDQRGWATGILNWKVLILEERLIGPSQQLQMNRKVMFCKDLHFFWNTHEEMDDSFSWSDLFVFNEDPVRGATCFEGSFFVFIFLNQP